jgi:predicted flavoprotein YhiN
LQTYRSWKEAKVTWWWVSINELDNFMQSKKHKWLFFIWEVVDITWKTWGFNLQWAWSSAFVCSEFFKK